MGFFVGQSDRMARWALIFLADIADIADIADVQRSISNA
jgi:hypothetical protein